MSKSSELFLRLREQEPAVPPPDDECSYCTAKFKEEGKPCVDCPVHAGIFNSLRDTDVPLDPGPGPDDYEHFNDL